MSRSAPVLVTGVPRSGTTWLARLLADGARATLPGREPMNPRGRQHALGGTLNRWTRVSDPTSRQALALRTAYWGLNPLAYSRFGHRQWAGPLPWRRVIVKDPFALLSLPEVRRSTGADIVLVYRHPGAVLSSYRRMGWSVDLDEVQASLDQDPWPSGTRDRVLPVLAAAGTDEVSQVAAFWNALHLLALHDLPEHSLVVAHSDVAGGGVVAARALFARLDLDFTDDAAAEMTRSGSGSQASHDLHQFDRNPADVAESWRRRLEPDEVARLEAATREVLAALDERRLDLAGA